MAHVTRIKLPTGKRSWTFIDSNDEVIHEARSWIINLEQTGSSPNTIKAYASQLAKFLDYLEKNNKSFDQVTIKDYDLFMEWLTTRKHNPDTAENIIMITQPKPDLLSASFKNQIHMSIKSFYRFLAQDSDLEIATRQKNNAHAYDKRRIFFDHLNKKRFVRQKDKYLRGDIGQVQKRVTKQRLTPEEVLSLIKCCRNIRDSFLIILLYNTGIRIGEALGLRHTDIDIGDGVIWIVPRDDNENGARAKSGRTRGIPVQPYLINMYEDYVTSNEYQLAFETGTPYVFCNIQRAKVGKALSLSYAGKLSRYLSNRSNIYFTWHGFRHTHASEAIAAGYSLLEVAERLGHHSPQTTADFYQHLYSTEIRRIYLKGPNELKSRLDELNDAMLFGKDKRWL